MYEAWLRNGEFLILGGIGLLLVLVRRLVFGRLCRDAALGSGAKGKMLRAMTLKFEKSYEVKVEITHLPVFVQKYLWQERRFGISLGRWRRLPERWSMIILCIGFLEALILRRMGWEAAFYRERFLAAIFVWAVLWTLMLLLESDSLWEQAQVSLLDYVANTLYPRQIHVYEGFEEEECEAPVKEPQKKAESPEPGKDREKKPEKKLVLEKEEERIFQEVLSDFLGSST